jgi:hypothetical protein
MSHARVWIRSALVCAALVPVPARSEEPLDTSHIRVKQAIAETMTPEQLEAYKQRLARNFANRPAPASSSPLPDTPGDTCPTATWQCVPFPAPQPDTTVGATDNYDLPPDTTAPTCTAASACTGAGPAGSLPRGAVYTGTGTGPDRAWRIRTDTNCNLTITMDPTGPQDLALIVYESTCSSLLSDCACVDDTGVGGVAESVTLSATAGTDYYIVVDGYSTGGTPPGPAGSYTLHVTGTGCIICPVELQSFRLD